MTLSKLTRWVKKVYEKALNQENQFVRRQGRKLVNLQLAERDAYMKEHHALLSQRGRTDEIVKRKIDYDQLFTASKANEGEKVLLEGDAGIGKSTFCTTFTSDWAKGNIVQQFDILLLLPFRDKEIARATSLLDLLKALHPNETVCIDAANEMEDIFGAKVLVIADGWDELSEELRSEDSFLYKFLLTDRILPSASILLTSRPTASVFLHNNPIIERFVEVVGFDRENIEEFIKSEFPSAVEQDEPSKDIDPCNISEKIPSEKASRLIENLDTNPLIESLCIVPLNCAIICYLWRELEETLPTTMTALYTKIIHLIVIRTFLKSNPQREEIKSLSGFNCFPDKDLQSQWWKLCEFAYQAIEKDLIVFTHDEVKCFYPKGITSVHEQQSAFGLLQSFESILSGGINRGLSFHFLHLTFQEYLAACYLVRQLPDKQFKVIESHAESSRFGMVWRFFFGISCTKSHKESDGNVQLTHELIAAFVGRAKNKKLLLCHCSFEGSANDDVTSHVAQTLAGGFQNVSPITAHDCAAMVSVISNIKSCDNMKISFSGCNVGYKGLTSLTQALASKSGKLHVETLNLNGNKLSDKSLSDLFNGASASFTSLTDLNLASNPLRTSVLENVVRSGTLANLNEVNLHQTLTSDVVANALLLAPLLEALSTCCHNLCALYLSNNNLELPCAQYLGNTLPQLTQGKRKFKLNLQETKLGDEAVREFCQNIYTTSNLYELDVSNNDMHCVGVSYLSDSIYSGVLIVKNLFLGGNSLGLGGVLAIGRMLSSSNCQLKWLSAENCQLTTASVSRSNCTTSDDTKLTITNVRKRLCKMPQNQSLTQLDVEDQNDFSGERIEVLVGLMYLCQNLTNLGSSQCNIASDSLDHLFHLLDVTIPTLKEWNLEYNDITDEGVSVLIKHLSLFPNIEIISLNGNSCVHGHMIERLNQEVAIQELHSQQLVGLRVVRGPDWLSGNEDGGDGHVGTVVKIGEPIDGGRRVIVQWDCGSKGDYNCGVDGKFTLNVLGIPGLLHDEVKCDYCSVHPIPGFRWKCVECFDCDLCTSCYMAGKVARGKQDSLKHAYECHDGFSDGGVQVPSRAGTRRIETRGIYPGAEVVRGPDWDYGEDDGGVGEIGIVLSLKYPHESDTNDKGDDMYDFNDGGGMDGEDEDKFNLHCNVEFEFDNDDDEDDDDEDSQRRYVTAEVMWISTDKATTHKLGQKGKVGIKCVTAASGGYYYPYYPHLPTFGYLLKLIQRSIVDGVNVEQKIYNQDWIRLQDSDKKKFTAEISGGPTDNHIQDAKISQTQQLVADEVNIGNDQMKHTTDDETYMEYTDSELVSSCEHPPYPEVHTCTTGKRKHPENNGSLSSSKKKKISDEEQSLKSSKTVTGVDITGGNKQTRDMLSIDDLREVRTAIFDVCSKWYDVGLELGLSDSSLQIIKADNSSQCTDCFTAMLRLWLQNGDPKPTWTSLIKALQSPPVAHPQLAKKLEKKYGKLSIDDLKEVRNALSDVCHKWYDIGLELGLSDTLLQTIKVANFHQPADCFTSMLRQWLQSVDLDLTWTCLIEALKSPYVNSLYLAEKLEKKYCE